MKLIRCDYCGVEHGLNDWLFIELNAIPIEPSKSNPGTLLPQWFNFCKAECFWAWAAKNAPSK